MRGNIGEDEGLVDAPIARDPRNRQRMAVRAGGRAAQTRFSVRERFGDYTLVEALLLTGRTHQIRVHFSSIGHPVAGDETYGSGRGLPGLERQFLHAALLRLRSPFDRREHTFRSPLPPDLSDALGRLPAPRTADPVDNCTCPQGPFASAWRPRRPATRTSARAIVALFNAAFARQRGGQFVLRIEDTDRGRYVENSDAADLSTRCAGSGSIGTRGRTKAARSRRTASRSACRSTRSTPAQLVEQGDAYECWCTPERLEEMRRAADGRQAAARLRPPLPGQDARRAGQPARLRRAVRRPHARARRRPAHLRRPHPRAEPTRPCPTTRSC